MIQNFDWRGHSEIVEFFGKKKKFVEKRFSLPSPFCPFSGVYKKN